MDIGMLTATKSSIGRWPPQQEAASHSPQSSQGEDSVGILMGITLEWPLILIATAIPLSGMDRTQKLRLQAAALMEPGLYLQEM
jgi:hypothetical protein